MLGAACGKRMHDLPDDSSIDLGFSMVCGTVSKVYCIVGSASQLNPLTAVFASCNECLPITANRKQVLNRDITNGCLIY